MKERDVIVECLIEHALESIRSPIRVEMLESALREYLAGRRGAALRSICSRPKYNVGCGRCEACVRTETFLERVRMRIEKRRGPEPPGSVSCAAVESQSANLQYLVAVWRDEPFRHIIDVRDNITDAAKLAEHFRHQWTHVYLAEVIAGEGPEGHVIIERLVNRGGL